MKLAGLLSSACKGDTQRFGSDLVGLPESSNGVLAPPPPPSALPRERPIAPYTDLPVGSAAALDEVNRVFRLHERDGTGSMDTPALMVALADLGLDANAAQASALLQRFDADRSGTIDVFEFRELASNLRSFQESRGGREGATRPSAYVEF